MTVKTFFLILGALALCLLGWVTWRLTHQWEYLHIGPYAVRRNAVTGKVQVADEVGVYQAAFTDDPYAATLPPADLKRLTIVDPACGANGILCARALVAPGGRLQGRLALQIQIVDIKRGKLLRDRTLRANVDWPGGGLTPFVLRTGLAAPDTENEKIRITPQPTLYSGE